MAKILTFNYTDSKGKKSLRTILVSSEPTDKVSGIDLSELEEVDQVNFALDYKVIHDEYIEKLEKLQGSYDCKFKYRQFFPAKMEDTTEDTV